MNHQAASMRLPRMTTRRLLALVAVLGVVLSWEVLSRRAEAYRHRASIHAREERHWADALPGLDRDISALKEDPAGAPARVVRNLESWLMAEHAWRGREGAGGGVASAVRAPFLSSERRYELARAMPGCRAYFAELSRWTTRLRLKYDRAARYPWLSVAPDPPPPR